MGRLRADATPRPEVFPVRMIEKCLSRSLSHVTANCGPIKGAPGWFLEAKFLLADGKNQTRAAGCVWSDNTP